LLGTNGEAQNRHSSARLQSCCSTFLSLTQYFLSAFRVGKQEIFCKSTDLTREQAGRLCVRLLRYFDLAREERSDGYSKASGYAFKRF